MVIRWALKWRSMEIIKRRSQVEMINKVIIMQIALRTFQRVAVRGKRVREVDGVEEPWW